MASEKGIHSSWLLHKRASLNNKSMVSILERLEKNFSGNKTVELDYLILFDKLFSTQQKDQYNAVDKTK